MSILFSKTNLQLSHQLLFKNQFGTVRPVISSNNKAHFLLTLLNDQKAILTYFLTVG